MNATTQKPDEYLWWRGAVAAVAAGTFDEFVKANPIFDGEPQSGRYRLRNKHKTTGEITYRPVAYWRDAKGAMLCRVGDVMQNEQRAAELWSYACRHPIDNGVYKHALATGEWPDVHPAAQADRSNSANALEPDSLEAVKDSVDNLTREAEAMIAKGAAKDKSTSDRALDLADRLRKLEVKADTRRKALHEPFKAEIKKLDDAWNPVRDAAGSAKERLKKTVSTPFLVAQDAEAARLREQEAKTGAPAAAPDARPRGAASPSAGSRLRSNKSAVITDYPKALAYFAENAKVRELIQQLADAAVRNGTLPDGCELKTEKVAA